MTPPKDLMKTIVLDIDTAMPRTVHSNGSMFHDLPCTSPATGQSHLYEGGTGKLITA